MYLEKLKYFIDLVQTGSFTKAGKKNFVSQASITQQIRFLETHFACQLIDRSTIPVKPTEAGKILYQESLQLMQQYDRLTQRMSDYNEQRNRIRIEYTSIMDIQLFSQVVQDKKLEEENILLDVEKVPLKGVAENLLNHRYDLAISFDSDFFEENQIKTLPLYYGDYCAVVGKKHPFFNKESLSLEELYEQSIIMLSPETIGKSYYLMLDHALQDGYAPNIAKVTDDIETEIFLIQNSEMVGFFPENYPLIGEEMDLKLLPIEDSHHRFEIVLAYLDTTQNAPVQRLLNLLK
ncbi:LysR family transcriptional regulator [Enterococcus sp.]|uniref:LysR family transcriptional regulator n=1 Tax=Enterococcus sp. TaxID=35783 RepID=UPI002906E7AA|nr:LysR family transcriptional regulator [Enterococcus sp.]MDU5335035.1 LysR family transcriptional regulator [Enterococcus sp.]